MKELISVIIPTRNSINTIEMCIKSIKEQTYENIEIIIVDTFSEDGTKGIIEKYDVKTFTGYYNKPEARNIGFLNSKGNMIIFADSDFVFSNNVINDIVREIKNGCDAVIIPEKILNLDIISKIRNLEKDTYIGDNQIEVARAYTKDIIEKIGLFDEKVVGPDEHDFYSRIVENGSKVGRINSFVYTIEPTFWKLLKKGFNHGKYWRLYYKKHRNIAKHQISFYVRIKKLFKAFNKDPMLGGLLFIIKGLEYIFLSTGIFSSYFDKNIIRLENDIKTKYDKEAEYYEQRMFHSSIGDEYVNKVEKEVALLPVIRNIVKDGAILDVGAGNGRWSKEFLKLGLNVTALDVSEEMYKKLKNDIKHQSFKVECGTIERTKFQDRLFDIIFSFRSFKYVYDDKKALFEIYRILKDDGMFIVEISNYINPFYFPLYILAPFLRYIIKKDTIEYMCIIRMYSSESFRKTAEKNGFETENVYPIFFFPHGIFSRINNDNILKVISTADRILCNIFTARSLIFTLRKTSCKQIPSNNCIIEDGQPLVSVVIPTYNRKEKLIRLIESVSKSDYTNIEIIVVDDASTDGTYETVQKLFPDIKIIRNEKELLISGTRNVGIKRAKGKFIFLIDDDNVVDNNTISNLVKIIDIDNSIGVIGPIMYYFNDKSRIWCAGIERNMFTSKTDVKGRNQVDSGQFNKISNSKDFPNAFLIRRDILETVGLFDSKNFPIHYEESDFCMRVRKIGNKIIINPEAKIWHDIPLTDEIEDKTRAFHIHNEFRAYYAARNRIFFHKKYSKLWEYAIFIIFFNWLFVIYYLKIILESDNKDKINMAKMYIKGVIDGLIS